MMEPKSHMTNNIKKQQFNAYPEFFSDLTGAVTLAQVPPPLATPLLVINRFIKTFKRKNTNLDSLSRNIYVMICMIVVAQK